MTYTEYEYHSGSPRLSCLTFKRGKGAIRFVILHYEDDGEYEMSIEDFGRDHPARERLYPDRKE